MKPIRLEDLPKSARLQIQCDGIGRIENRIGDAPIHSLLLPGEAKPRARARRFAGKMNATERAYATELAARQRDGLVSDFKFEPWAFLLANDCRYTPDFLVILADGLAEIHETKAWWKKPACVGWNEDAKIKFRMAASQHPWFRFVSTWQEPGKPGWQTEDFNP